MKRYIIAILLATAVLLTGCGRTAQGEPPAAEPNTEGSATTAEAEVTAEPAAEEAAPEESAPEDPPAPEVTEPEPEPEPELPPLQIWRAEHRPVKGIFVAGPMAGSSGMDDLIALVDETELNAMVIDIKNDEGQVTYLMENETVQEIGAGKNFIRDIDALMAKLKEHDIYTIARIVCFKDPILAEGKPELALKTPSGKAIVDGNGLAWVNPASQEVWDYLVELAVTADELGFDEIQFDYVRCPVGNDANEADYGMEMTEGAREQIINGFLSYATEQLHEHDIVVTADVFGTIIGSETDKARVGQDYVNLSHTIDAICPMVYPSHYGNGNFGLDVPDAHPYDCILAAMQKSQTELSVLPAEETAVVRPWLQAFTATWIQGHISYEGKQIREQIQAVYDAGYDEWILWNARNHYSADGLLTEEDAAEEKAAKQAAEEEASAETENLQTETAN